MAQANRFFLYIVSRPTFVTLISIQHDLGLHGKVNYVYNLVTCTFTLVRWAYHFLATDENVLHVLDKQ